MFLRPVVFGHVLLLLASMGASVAAAQPSPSSIDLNAQEEFYLEAHGAIRYVMPFELPPTVFTDEDGQVKGIAIDLLNLMSIRLGAEFEVVDSDNFSHAIDMVRTGEADVIGPFTPSAEREADFDFTTPFIRGSLGYWVAADAPGIGSPDDLAGRRVAVIGGATSSGWIEENRPDVEPVAVQDTLDALRKLDRGEVDAFFGSFALAAYYVDREGLDDLKPLGEPIAFADGAWAVADGEVELLSIMNKGLDAVGSDDLKAIYVKWTGYDLGLEEAPRTAHFYQNPWVQGGVLAAVGITLALSLWSTSLRRTVHRRTQELARTNEQLNRLITASPVGILSIGPDGRVISANRAFERMLGYRAGATVGVHIVELSDPKDLAATKRMLDEAAAGRLETADFEKRYRRRDGTLVWARVRAAVVRDAEGRFEHSVNLVTDLTEERKAQEAQRATVEREQENRRLREIDEFKTQFFNAVAHELNTPLTPIQVQLHLLRSGKLGELSTLQADSVAVLDRNLTRVGNLVADMLDVARLQNGRIRLRPRRFDLSQAVREAVETFHAAAESKGLTIEAHIEEGLEAEADPDRIAQVLLNLISNAVKYTDRGTVAVHATSERGHALIEIRDTGAGLTAEQQKHLFKPFSVVQDAPNQAVESTGLGLYICRGLVALHGGRIWAHSEGAGRGSVFGFALPIVGRPRIGDGREAAKQVETRSARPGHA